MAALLKITPAPGDLARLYSWLDEAAAGQNIPEALLIRIHVVLEEAVMNVVMHGLPPEAEQTILVEFTSTDNSARLIVSDYGPAFNPLDVQPIKNAATLEQTKIGGKGLRLMRKYCADLAYERSANQNRLTLHFTF